MTDHTLTYSGNLQPEYKKTLLLQSKWGESQERDVLRGCLTPQQYASRSQEQIFFDVLSQRDRRSRPNLLPHPVTVC